ncbi:MAG: hypothetical protein D6698_14320 [Gammaproteobacteria bacterium]|nr:MAG: hypothetical protein D6698_14320 [Gammaproteobacteria bacterium]
MTKLMIDKPVLGIILILGVLGLAVLATQLGGKAFPWDDVVIPVILAGIAMLGVNSMRKKKEE